MSVSHSCKQQSTYVCRFPFVSVRACAERVASFLNFQIYYAVHLRLWDFITSNLILEWKFIFFLFISSFPIFLLALSLGVTSILLLAFSWIYYTETHRLLVSSYPKHFRHLLPLSFSFSEALSSPLSLLTK